jgi:hypothetical protein
VVSREDDQARIADRYARRPSAGRTSLLAAGALIAVLLVGWVAWVAWDHGHPKVNSAMDSWTITSPNAVAITVAVKVYDAGSHPVCSARAFASDHSTVGQLQFTPIDGRQTVTIQTEREATSVDWIGCSADGQDDSR